MHSYPTIEKRFATPDRTDEAMTSHLMVFIESEAKFSKTLKDHSFIDILNNDAATWHYILLAVWVRAFLPEARNQVQIVRLDPAQDTTITVE